MDRLGGLVVIELETRVRILVQARIFSLKLLIYDIWEGYSKAKISSKLVYVINVDQKEICVYLYLSEWKKENLEYIS